MHDHHDPVETAITEIKGIHDDSDAKREDFESRCKIACIRQELLIDLVNWCTNPYGFYQLPVMESLPEGTIVTSVQYCWERRALLFRVNHPSFEPVPPGMCPPYLEDMISCVYRRPEGSTELEKIQ